MREKDKMKKIKKFTSVIMVMLLALSCTACGFENAGYEGGQVTELEQKESVAETIEEAVEDSAEESVVGEGKEFSLGRMQGGVYTNEYLGAACELDSTWTFYTAEELQELPDEISDAIAGSELGDALSGIQQIMDMQAENVTELTNVNVLYQKLSVQEQLAYKAVSETAIIENMVSSQAELLKESYEQAGIIVEELNTKTVTFLGEEKTALYTKAKVEEADYYVLQLFDFDLGDYSVTLTFSSFLEDKTEALLDLFYAL